MFPSQAGEVESHGQEDGDDEAGDEDEEDQVDRVVRHGPESQVQEEAERNQQTWKREVGHLNNS